MKSWIRLLRIEHWFKNLLVFAPVFFAGKILDKNFFFLGLLSFLSFSFLASSLYIINDIKDIPFDRLHPQKKYRPLASGEISLFQAKIMAILMCVLGFFLGFNLGKNFLFILLLYAILNIAYSFRLKSIVPLDVFCVSLGYLLRIIAGGKATNIDVSPWLFMSAFLLALFIAFGKRLGEIRIYKQNKENFRPSLILYQEKYLFLSLGIAGSSSLVAYALYSVEKGGRFVYTIIPAAYGIFRYLQNILQSSLSGEPLNIFFRDFQLWLVSLIFLIQIFLIIYY